MTKANADLTYHYGWGNEFQSEAIPGALPLRGSNPQRPAWGLYAEQLSGTAFTALPHENRRSWLYRLSPSVSQGEFAPLEHSALRGDKSDGVTSPNALRWDPFAYPAGSYDFVDGLKTILVTGSITAMAGGAVHYYHATSAMTDRVFYNSDGELLVVPQEGSLTCHTEFGALIVSPGEIAVLPRGVKFQIDVAGRARGYVLENFGAYLRLPYRGPIGANGLANARDFRYPTARFRDRKGAYHLVAKFQGKLWQAEMSHDPLDVVAWHGNYAPYAYDLGLFNTMNTVSFDHPDPSIFTVLTSPSLAAGTANFDFVIFPPRWMVAEDTFRPPYFHRNVMSEFMGLIHGVYDAKTSDGFVPGGASLHNAMTPHGPDCGSWKAATEAKLVPHKQDQTLAFMFESSQIFQVTSWALSQRELQKDYRKCWQGFPRPKLPS